MWRKRRVALAIAARYTEDVQPMVFEAFIEIAEHTGQVQQELRRRGEPV